MLLNVFTSQSSKNAEVCENVFVTGIQMLLLIFSYVKAHKCERKKAFIFQNSFFIFKRAKKLYLGFSFLNT